MNIEVLWDGAYGLSSLSEKTRKSNHLQMSLQRQHFLLGYLKTLSVGPAGYPSIRLSLFPFRSAVRQLYVKIDLNAWCFHIYLA